MEQEQVNERTGKFKTTEKYLSLENCRISCLKCEKDFEFPLEKDAYLGHIFLTHRLVIANVDDIIDLPHYLLYWQNEFKNKNLDFFCTTMLLNQLPDGTPSNDEKYYLLSDDLPQDYEIRRTLKTTRLENALSQYQFERTDVSFSKECFLCKDVLKGLRYQYIDHLFQKHFFQLGKPEKLVYIDHLIATIEQKLEKLICLYCEKLFKDRFTLKEHMRKKGHKQINPNHSYYDRFYLQNYKFDKLQTMGSSDKTQKKFKQATENIYNNLNNKQQKELLVSCESDNSDSDWNEWDDENFIFRCLFCSIQETNFSKLNSHMILNHKIDIEEQMKGLNFYEQIKIVNYIRRQMAILHCVACNSEFGTTEELEDHMKKENHLTLGGKKQWDKAEYLFPTLDDDGLLCFLNDSTYENMVRVFSEQFYVEKNKEAEKLSIEISNFN